MPYWKYHRRHRSCEATPVAQPSLAHRLLCLRVQKGKKAVGNMVHPKHALDIIEKLGGNSQQTMIPTQFPPPPPPPPPYKDIKWFGERVVQRREVQTHLGESPSEKAPGLRLDPTPTCWKQVIGVARTELVTGSDKAQIRKQGIVVYMQ